MAVDPDISADLMEGARNLVRYAEIRAGQKVLIHSEPRYDDPRVPRALGKAVEETGAEVAIIKTGWWHKWKEPPPLVFERALEGCDVLIGQGEYLYTKNNYLQIAVFERGLIYIENEAKTVETLSSEYGRFPAELLFAIGTRIMNKLAAGTQVRVTTARGTDVTMGVDPRHVGGYCYPFQHDSPGHKKGFPGGTACLHPEDPVNGVIMAEAIIPGVGAPKTLLDTPLRLTVRDHHVVDMEGDCADWLRDYWATNGDAGSSWLGECMWGIHPKATGEGGRAASNPHLLHFGLGQAVAYGGRNVSRTWLVVYVEDATVAVDGATILDRGRLTIMKDPAVRAVAAKYGDPDRWLSLESASLATAWTRGW